MMEINFDKDKNGLVPAIIQDSETKNVLMLGYMNRESYEKTLATNKVTFFSRSKNRLWTKGAESGNFLELVNIKIDCDNDALLIQAKPFGAVCHTGNATCWEKKNEQNFGFLNTLQTTIENRRNNPTEGSYVSSLFKKGINKMAQKVGEEAVEVVIEAKDSNDELFLNESADLLFHYLILLQAKGFKIENAVDVLKQRDRNN